MKFVVLLLVSCQLIKTGTDANDIQKIARHLEAVEARLRRAPVEHLSTEQRAARSRHLDALRAYRLRGIFPHNHRDLHREDPGIPGGFARRPGERRAPVFRDEHGTWCAVGQLLVDSGAEALASEIAAQHNTGYIAELEGPGLVAWAASAGLSLHELAQIQPGYTPTPAEINRERQLHAIAITTATGLTAWNVYQVAEQRRSWVPGILGLIDGVVELGLVLDSRGSWWGIDNPEVFTLRLAHSTLAATTLGSATANLSLGRGPEPVTFGLDPIPGGGVVWVRW